MSDIVPLPIKGSMETWIVFYLVEKTANKPIVHGPWSLDTTMFIKVIA